MTSDTIQGAVMSRHGMGRQLPAALITPLMDHNSLRSQVLRKLAAEFGTELCGNAQPSKCTKVCRLR